MVFKFEHPKLSDFIVAKVRLYREGLWDLAKSIKLSKRNVNIEVVKSPSTHQHILCNALLSGWNRPSS